MLSRGRQSGRDAQTRSSFFVAALAPVLTVTLGLGLGVTTSCGDDGASETDAPVDDSGGPPDNPDPHVTLEAEVDVFELCGAIGSSHLSLRATRINCEQDPPPPCTLPKDPYETSFGDTRDCEKPTQTSTKMYLDLEQSGRYLIEVVTLTDSGEVGACYGVDGGVETPITSAQIEARETLKISSLGGGPCPSP